MTFNKHCIYDLRKRSLEKIDKIIYLKYILKSTDNLHHIISTPEGRNLVVRKLCRLKECVEEGKQVELCLFFFSH